MPGLLLAFEGVDGCGKTTQLERLHDRLMAAGYDCLKTREPGGTAAGEAIRQVLLDPAGQNLTAVAEMFLFCAARAELVDKVIRPALGAGRIVLCDRFGASTAVYQGYAGGLGFDTAERIIALATGGLEPDLTLIFDLDPALGRQRKHGASGSSADRMENKAADFHRQVREGYLQYAQRHANRCAVISAAGTVEQVAQAVWDCVAPLLSGPGGE